MSSARLTASRAAFNSLPEHRQGLLGVTAAAVLWSTGGLFIKWVSLDALGVTMWRSLLAGITIAAITRPPFVKPWRVNALTWGLALSYAATMLLFVTATKTTTAANAIFLQYTAPLYLLVLGALFLGERATRLDVATVAVAFGGMALFFVGRLETDALWGNIAALSAGVTLAVMMTLLRHRSCGPHTRPQAMILGNAVLVVGLFVVNVGRGEGSVFTPGLADVAGLLFLGIVQIGVAYIFFAFAMARVQALEASLIGMLEPVLNPVWVFLFLGETPGWWAVLGGAILVSAVGTRTWVTERNRSPGEPRELPMLSAEA
ncbi:MAG: DMT family transporter [Tepidiformaceae bacterium]